MKTYVLRRTGYLLALIGLGCCLVAEPAMAKTAHHKKHHHKIASHKGALKNSTYSSLVKTAQGHLVNLGYLTDHPDGIPGPKTMTAIRKFQRDYSLPVSGRLTTQTYNALIKADGQPSMASALPSSAPPVVRPTDFYADHPDYYGNYDQQYADPMMLSPAVAGAGTDHAPHTQAVFSRFAKLDVAEKDQGPQKSYTVTVNGQPLFQANDQPSVIGISQTYDLGSEDAIIFSTYRNNDPVCAYQSYLLVTNPAGNNFEEISNCTRGYQAHVKDGSLFITFPEFDDNRAVGATWRYEKGSLQRL